jgi:hypothetical protein
MIQADKTEDKARIVLPQEENLWYGIRQYTGDIIIAGHTEDFDSRRTLREYEESKDFSYVVIEKESEKEKLLIKRGYTKLGESTSYLVYKKQ